LSFSLHSLQLTARRFLLELALGVCAGPQRNLSLDFLVHDIMGLFDLLLHVVVGLIIHFGADLSADLLQLLHLCDLFLILTLDHIQSIGKFRLFGVLLGDPGLRHLELHLDLLSFSHRRQLQ